jgi:DNA invertase Pin-like site-specific DNA recombinase
MNVALYARVSTQDKEQNPEVQLVALREYCELAEWEIHGEYVDKASAGDLVGRTAWTRLMKDFF